MKSLAILSLLSVVVATAACSQSERPGSAGTPTQSIPVQGTVDGGGGNTIPQLSSALQVRSFLDQLRQLSADPESFQLFQIGDDWRHARQKKHQFLLKEISEKASGLLRQLFADGKVFLQVGACIDPHNASPRDGSAIGMGPAGSICLSEDRLRQIPPRELRSQIVALLLHEVVHLLGYGEEYSSYAQGYYLRDIATAGEFYFEPRCGHWVASPFSARCMIGDYRLIYSSIRPLPDPYLSSLENTKAFLDQKGISCLDSVGRPLNWATLVDVLGSEDSKGKLGFPENPISSPARRDEYLKLLSKLIHESLAYSPVYDFEKGSIAKEPFIPQLSDDWSRRVANIEKIREEIYQQWLSFYPEARTSGERQFSACQLASYREQVTYYQKLASEMRIKIAAELTFD